MGYAGFGLIFSGGVLAGIVGNVFGGPLTERVGTRITLSRGALAWSCLNLAAALAAPRVLFALFFVLAFGAGAVADARDNGPAVVGRGVREGVDVHPC